MTDNLTHHNLKAEWVSDKHGTAVMLTQQDESGCYEPSTVLVHPWQLRAVCEQFGLVAASNPVAARNIATLTRRMVALRDRIESLRDYIADFSDHAHADLSAEMTRINALADLAREWCHDLTDDEQGEPQSIAPEVVTVTTPAAQGSLL